MLRGAILATGTAVDVKAEITAIPACEYPCRAELRLIRPGKFTIEVSGAQTQ